MCSLFWVDEVFWNGDVKVWYDDRTFVDQIHQIWDEVTIVYSIILECEKDKNL